MPAPPVLTVDLDDTLWDAGPTLAAAERTLYDWLARHAPAVTARRDAEAVSAHRRALAARRPELAHDMTALRLAALTELMEEADAEPALAAEAMEVFLEARNRVRLFDDALEALETLGRRYRLVALSNGNACVHRIGIGHFFTLAVNPALTGVAKPHPGMFAHVLSALEADPSRLLHVGDDPWYDVEAAHRAGVGAVWMNRAGRAWPEEFRPARAEVGSLGELPAVLERLLPG